MAAPLRKQLLFFLKLLVSIGFVVWLVWRINWGDVFSRILEIDLPYLVLYIALLLFGIMISARKWQIIAKAKGFSRLYRDFFRAYLTGTFINNFLPSTIGGDAYRALWLGRLDGKLSPAISTAFFDRFTGLWAAMVFGFLFSLAHFKLVLANPFWLAMNSALFVLLLVDLSFPFVRKLEIVRRIFVTFPEKIQYLIREIVNYPLHGTVIPALGFSLLFNLVGVGFANLVLFWALGGQVQIFQYLGVIFLVSIVSSIPISINNIGLKEWAYATFFGFLGASVETAVAVAVTSRVIQMLVSFSAIPFYLRSRDLLGREVDE